ncbi:subtilisin inhibitor CLSI-I-like [Olea europaea var. sylvestris]|uniref:Subtilisin inhibitor-like n=1 Tax=Olea europaea subsp. europaea TaxID=158383 RepID=A0A8S0PQG4_OLEEU|nr:subtilisin inhibitor CLSI-I-like [Olea europaea var. sylvestris]CAA2954407.1 subtilisin inhibitor-like [Olea europaea subsp. europaea]
MAEKNKEKELSEESPMEPLNIIGFPGHATGKTSWAEVVGLTAEEAERKIKEEMAGVQIQIVPQDAFVTMDYQSNRVRIFVDSSGKVTKPPRIG